MNELNGIHHHLYRSSYSHVAYFHPPLPPPPPPNISKFVILTSYSYNSLGGMEQKYNTLRQVHGELGRGQARGQAQAPELPYRPP